MSPYASQNEQGVARAGGSEFSFELSTDEPVWDEDGEEDSMDTVELIQKLPKRARWINEKPIECNPLLSPTKKLLLSRAQMHPTVMGAAANKKTKVRQGKV